MIRREIEEDSFRLYVSNALYAMSENTSVPAAAYTGGKAGKTMAGHWQERPQPAPEETRTADEIVAHIRNKIQQL